jgi:hypothetical protein
MYYTFTLVLSEVCAVPNMAVFCRSLISCLPGMLLRRFLNDFEMIPVGPVFMGFTFDFIFHVRCICIVSCLCFRTISAYFLVTCLYYNVYYHHLLPYVRYLYLYI